MSVGNAILLGLVQGITEFLPVSSSGHLSILNNLFGLSTGGEEQLLFDVLLHLGTMIAILIRSLVQKPFFLASVDSFDTFLVKIIPQILGYGRWTNDFFALFLNFF